MTDTGKNAITTYTYSGTGTLYIDFEFLDKDDVLVQNVTVPSAITTFVRGTHYSIDNTNFLTWKTSTDPTSPPVAGQVIRLTRVTPHSSVVVSFVEGKPVLGTNLNKALKQGLYYTAEIEDKI